jgi:hypothetical protein
MTDAAAQRDWMERLRDRLVGFHRDEQGQSIVYLVLIMFLLACFTFMVINSGALLNDKVLAQGAADSAVISGSTWVVRAMNLNSMMNILMAMLMAQEIYMKAVFWTALTAVILSPAIEAFWLGVCVTTGTCNPAVEVIFDTIELWPVLFETEDHEDFIWDIMETLSDVEEGVHIGFSAAAFGESVRIAMMNHVGFGGMYPFTVPEEQGELQDLCECTLSGAPSGYNEIIYSGAGSILTAVSEIGGFSYAGDLRDIAANLIQGFLGLGGPLWGEMQVPYHVFWASTAPYHFTNIMFILAVWARYSVMCGGGFGPSSINFEIDAAWWCFFCDDNNISIPNPFSYLGAAFAFLETGNPNVQPYMLVDDWEDKRNYFGVAYKTGDDIKAHYLPEVFRNPMGETTGMLTLSQAQIYSPHEDDGLFGPHWRTHMTPLKISEIGDDIFGGLFSSPMPADAGVDPSASGGAMANLFSVTGAGVDALFAH